MIKKIQKSKEDGKALLLNPSCSVIVCRIPLYKKNKFEYSDNEEFCTDSYPNGTIDCFISIVKEMKEKGLKKMSEIPELDYVDNEGGGGNWDYIEKAWQIAILYGSGEINEEQAMKMDDDLWNDESEKVLTDICKKCFSENPKKDCKNIVKRIIGECEGIRKKSLYEYIDEEYQKIQEAEINEI